MLAFGVERREDEVRFFELVFLGSLRVIERFKLLVQLVTVDCIANANMPRCSAKEFIAFTIDVFRVI